MSLPTANFWRLLEESRLQSAEQCQQLREDFAHVKGAGDQGNSKTLAEWLVARNILSRYQTTILLGGRSGPFLYGDYSVYDRIDKGRLAGSFRAIHRPTGHPVLLTFLTGPVIQDARLWAAAANDALTASQIQSPHVQRFFEPVDLVSFKFLVSEDLRGSSADERLASGRFSAPEACRLVRMAAVGLAQMHQAGRVHGDLRPANLWVENAAPTNPGNLKLLFEPHLPPQPVNFAAAENAAKLSQQADYLAPELMQAGKVPDPLSDVYSLGCALYCLLSGTPPFAGGNVQQKMVRHASEAIRPLEQFGVLPQLAQLVAFMMAKNPAVRFQSASLVAEQLTPFVDPQLVYIPPPSPPATQGAYESWISQKQGQLASQAAVAATAPKPVVPAFPGLNLKLDDAKSAKNTTPAGPMIRTGESSAKKDAVTTAAYDEAKQKQQMQYLLVGLAVAGVLAIGGVIGVNMMGKGKQPVAEKPSEEKAAENTNPGEEGSTANGSTKVTNTSSGAGTKSPLTTPEKLSPETNPGEKAKPEKGSSGAPATIPVPPGETGTTQEIIPDDGNSLWASPTSGRPVSFRCVPPVGQIFLITRPSDILATSEGPKVLDALGPNFPAARSTLETASGLKLADMEQLIVVLHNNDGKFPRTSFVIRTKEPQKNEDLLAKWGGPMEQKEGNASYYTASGRAYFIDPLAEEKRFVIGDPVDIKEVAKSAGAAPGLFRDIERLRRSTDSDRHFTVLFNPSFFFNDDGAPLFEAERAKVKGPLSWFLGDDLQAGLVSMQFGESFYLELRLLSSLNKPKFDLAKEVRERLRQIPTKLEDYFVFLTPPPYWKKLSNRYPQMIFKLHENMRVGVENDQAVMNGYVEGPAAHNLVLGGELLLVSAPGTAVAAVTPKETPPAVKTIEEALALKTSMTFDSQQLDFVMRDLAEDVKTNLLKGSPVEFAIKVIGKDLEIDGITRNQSVRDFKQENKTVAEVLTAVVRKANPDPSAKEASDAAQKLVWVVGPDPDDAKRNIVLITTRQAVEKKSYTLPDVFKLKK
jgi:eukaryotic-like serine/threonine-protein kinase